MLTPRHQALLATLAGMTVGVAVFGSVLAINRDTSTDTSTSVTTSPSSPTPTEVSPDGGPPVLQANRLQYTAKTFTHGRIDVSAEVPADWTLKPEGWDFRYLDSSDTWLIRFNPKSSSQSPEQSADSRARRVRAERNLRIVSTVSSTQPASWSPDGVAFTTLVYTYTDFDTGKARPRMVLSRWISVDGGKHSALEITVAGRPEDEAGLHAVLDHATQTLELPGP